MASPSGKQAIAEHADALQACLRQAAALAKRGQHHRALALIDAAIARYYRNSPAMLLRDLRGLRTAITKQRRSMINRLLTLAAFAVSVVTVGFLQFTYVHSAEVVIEVKANEVYFQTAEDGSLSSGDLAAVLISDLDELRTESKSVRVFEQNGQNKGPTAPEIEAGAKPSKPLLIRPVPEEISQTRLWGDHLKLDRLELKEDAGIDIHQDSSSGVTLSLNRRRKSALAAVSGDRTAESAVEGPPVHAEIGTGRNVSIDCGMCDIVQDSQPPRVVSLINVTPVPRQLFVQGRAGGSDLGLTFAGKGGLELTGSGLPLRSIAFTSLDRDKEESTVQEGTVRLVDLNDKSLAIGERDFLYVKSCETGEKPLVLKRLAVGPTVLMRLEGDVCDLSISVGQTRHSRMPTRLERLKANSPLELFLGAVSAVFAFLAAAILRLGIGQRD